MVGLYITAAYWFTASTSFANPAVAIARSMTNTFSGIRPVDLPGFVGADLGALTKEAAVKKLFDDLGPRFATRPGGYTRILRLGPRKGDGAEMAIVELLGSEFKPKSESKEKADKAVKADQAEKPEKAEKAEKKAAPKKAAPKKAKAKSAEAAE